MLVKEELTNEVYLGIVTMNLINLYGKNLLRKQIYGYFDR